MAHSDEVIVFGPRPALSLPRFLSQRTGPLSGCFGIPRAPPTRLPPRQGGIQKVTLSILFHKPETQGSCFLWPTFLSSCFWCPPSSFSPTLSLSLVGLSSYVPWASLFLWPPWLLNSGGTTEKTSVRMWLYMRRGGRMLRTFCAPTLVQSLCLCVFVTFENYS